MKEVLKLMANYNKQANTDMVKCLHKANPADLTKDVGIYYKSIMDTLEHNLSLDIMMFGDFFRKYCKHPDELLVIKGLKASENKDLDYFIKTRQLVDNAIVQVIDDIDKLSEVATLAFPNVKFDKPLYQLVASILTHSTHHRGQVAAALDILGIDNDFAGMLAL